MPTSRATGNFTLLCLTASLGLAGLAQAEGEADVAAAQTALAQGRCAQAYALLEPLEPAQAGNPAYDRLFGQAALQCGHAGRAAFALERLLANAPDDASARIQLAQAQKNLGELAAARQLLKSGLNNASGQDRQATNKLLADLERRPAERSRTTAYVELGLGYDSNSNAATSSSLVDTGYGFPLPVIPGFTSQADNFANLAGGINFRHPVAPGAAVFASLSGSQRFNQDHQALNFGNLDANLGASLRNNDDTYILALQDGHAFLDGIGYRHAYGLTGQWQHMFDSNRQLTAYAQALRLDYNGQSIRNADRFVGGVRYRQPFAGNMMPTLSVNAYAGTENERADGVPYLGHKLAGLRLSGDLTLNARTIAYANAAFEHRDYGGQDPVWGLSRDDDEYRVAAGLRYSPAPMWTIRPELAYVRNHSSIEFNDYHRTVFSVSVRRDFDW